MSIYMGSVRIGLVAGLAACSLGAGMLPGSVGTAQGVEVAQGAARSAVAVSTLKPLPTRTSAYLPGTHCRAFPATSWWHTNISRLPVHKRSAQWLSHMSPRSKLHPDFGPSYGESPVPYGIAITVVRAGHVKVLVHFDYADESNRVRYPLGPDTRIEGGPNSDGDRHAIVVDAATCFLYETWDTHGSGTSWSAGSGAVWSLRSTALRPRGWTSADAAGLPILPGLLRYDEVVRGKVDHAIRFTTNITDRKFIWPARHQAGSVRNAGYPPMGARFRLKKSFRISGFSRDARVVLQAMKAYGLVLADNGSPWFFQGTSDSRWGSSLISSLKRIPASAFEAVNTSSMRISTNSMKSRR